MKRIRGGFESLSYVRDDCDHKKQRAKKEDLFSIPRSIMVSIASKNKNNNKKKLVPPPTPYLPNELLPELVIEILEWLPVKSIVRFMLVSQSWSALFKTPSFTKNHLIKQRTKVGGPMLLLRRRLHADVLSFHNLDSPDEEVRPSIPTSVFEDLVKGHRRHDTTRDMRFLGSINGIVCIRRGDDYILSNPALHQFKLLPPSLIMFKPPYLPYLLTHLCTDGFSVSTPSSSSSSSSVVEHFKVITMHKLKYVFQDTWIPSNVVVHLYDSRTDFWRQHHVGAPADPDNQVMGHVIFLNGACHWLARSFSQHRRRMILSFDMTSEVFKQFEFPNCLMEFSNDSHLIVLDNCQGLVKYKESHSESDPVEIWVMKEYGVRDSWAKLFVIGPQPFARVFLPWKDVMLVVQEPRKNIEPAAGHQLQDIENSDPQFNGYLTSITLRTNGMKKFQVTGAENTLRALIYEESLVRLKY